MVHGEIVELFLGLSVMEALLRSCSLRVMLFCTATLDEYGPKLQGLYFH